MIIDRPIGDEAVAVSAAAAVWILGSERRIVEQAQMIIGKHACALPFTRVGNTERTRGIGRTTGCNIWGAIVAAAIVEILVVDTERQLRGIFALTREVMVVTQATDLPFT